jgi:hypothetical protein
LAAALQRAIADQRRTLSDARDGFTHVDREIAAALERGDGDEAAALVDGRLRRA